MPARTPRRKTLWRRFLTEDASLAAGVGSVTAISLLAAAIDNQGRTIMRVIGDINVVAGNLTGTNTFSMGIYMDSSEAVTAGVTLEPRSDSGPWMWLAQRTQQIFQSVGEHELHIPIDVKARRKLTSQSVLMLVFESGTMVTAMEINIQGRVLMALP